LIRHFTVRLSEGCYKLVKIGGVVSLEHDLMGFSNVES
jgi:hypothetical protein